jgi:hypothetical protein
MTNSLGHLDMAKESSGENRRHISSRTLRNGQYSWGSFIMIYRKQFESLWACIWITQALTAFPGTHPRLRVAQQKA